MNPRVCLEDGCPEITVRSKRCEVHAKALPRSPSSTLTSAPGWRKIRGEVLDRDDGICHVCGLPGADTADHVEPASYGGESTHANLKAAHRACNARKSNHVR